ncbi:MAG: tRNA (guanosine(37)-N1)-methyltransferase TrmD [Bacteroidia bacterium]|nr:tRNA (guanosine(37)-N1)-methyltransferase TrmD [Bacteroidia bacterium]MCO5252847.1 tRNA (guanosine(37)-N1)-methyltransferase TrmD [Bacteroidota bacterium]MCZ2129719.1 tRNA (guanosine(37)-N1)-methyltransferase TrmD [Bacteroidia bacterium]
MRIDIITVLPELLQSPFNHSIIQRAKDKGLVEIHIHALRDYADNKYKQVDDYPYGGGAGMVIMPSPLAKCIEKLKAERSYDEIIFLTPDGLPAKQKLVNTLSLTENLLIISGHYKGIDQRIRDKYVTLEISIGDFVVTGGEIPTALLVDGIVRLIPGVISNEESALSDSFQDGLLAPPVYTRPAEFEGMKVPDVLLSGNFKEIENWRLEQAEKRTQEKRPDLFN